MLRGGVDRLSINGLFLMGFVCGVRIADESRQLAQTVDPYKIKQ